MKASGGAWDGRWGVGESEALHPASSHLFRRRLVWCAVACTFLLFAPHPAPRAPLSAAQVPSLFRGVVVADSPLGVRVVSVEESSQAFLADLRPEDLIVRIQGQDVHSIDEFAVLSNDMRARAVAATVVVFRNGTPHELKLHAYSYPILREWGVEFVPDHDLRFAQPQIGLDYWTRLGRGFEEAGKLPEALNAYLNGLHNVPRDAATALKVAELFSRVSHQRLAEGALAEGIVSLRQAVLVTEKLFDYPLTDEQLQTIRRQLQETVSAIRARLAI